MKPGIQKATSFEDYEIEIDEQRYNNYKELGLTLEELEGV